MHEEDVYIADSSAHCAMFVIAEQSGQREIVFPEISALALGAWIMEKPPWKGSILDFWLSPTLAAMTGILIVRYFTYSPVPMITVAFCLVFLQLRLLRSGILPQESLWSYPWEVFFGSATFIAVSRLLSVRTEPMPAIEAGSVE